MATSAIWKITKRPWLTTFAPILISLSFRLVSDQSLIGYRFGGSAIVVFGEPGAWRLCEDTRRRGSRLSRGSEKPWACGCNLDDSITGAKDAAVDAPQGNAQSPPERSYAAAR